MTWVIDELDDTRSSPCMSTLILSHPLDWDTEIQPAEKKYATFVPFQTTLRPHQNTCDAMQLI